jgi:hypothetical protein
LAGVLGAAAVIVAVYAAAVAALQPDGMLNYDAGIRNRVVAERYVDDVRRPVVLAGSSETMRLSADFMEADVLGPNIFNLGLAGENSALALDFILRAQTQPSTVFVEIDRAETAYHPSFADEIFREPGRSLRGTIAALRTQNRPLDVLIVETWQLSKSALTRFGSPRTERLYSVPLPSRPQNSAPPTAQMRTDNRLFDAFDRGLALIGDRVDALRAHGVRVVITWFPAHPAYDGIVLDAYKAAAARVRFPAATYGWLDLRVTGRYDTDDGLHLVRASARAVAGVIRSVAETGKVPSTTLP